MENMSIGDYINAKLLFRKRKLTYSQGGLCNISYKGKYNFT